MGVFDALNTAVAGLQAQAFALQNISGNIANAQTTGFKGTYTNFVDLVPDSRSPERLNSGSVTSYSQATISTQGSVTASTVGTHMAIRGDGFFNVQRSTGAVDGSPTFSGVTNYTRRGDFQVNSTGNLVNGAGYYLMGVSVDKAGNALGNVPQVLQFKNNFIPAQATTSVQYSANLPRTPTTAASSTATAGSLLALGCILPSDFTGQSIATIQGGDNATFMKESISGGAVTAYDATGGTANMQLRWAKTDSAALGGSHTDKWNLFYQTNSTAGNAVTSWINVGTDFTFNSSGVMTAPTSSSLALTNVSVDGVALSDMTFNVGAGGLTQYSSTGGTATINGISQNGYAAGQLQAVTVSDSGLVVGAFSNGQNVKLASVALSHFNGTNYLQSLDGGAYAVTEKSGTALDGASGAINGSALESSNTDIADEFTKLIVTQQAYSANTKVITTANSMVQDLLNVLR